MLVRAREVRVRLSDEDEVIVGGEQLHAPRVALTLLDAFSFAAQRERGPRGGRRRRRRAAREAETCVERHRSQRRPRRSADERAALGTRGWVRRRSTCSMLDDRGRTNGFCHALRTIVKPDDVVVDIGTGTGVLATCAALAGARKVYAVESSGIAEVAARVFAANGVTDRVTLVRERSTSAHAARARLGPRDRDDRQRPARRAAARDRRRREEATPRAGRAHHPVGDRDLGASRSTSRARCSSGTCSRRARSRAIARPYGIDFSPLEEHRLSCSEPIMLDSRDVATWPLGRARAPRVGRHDAAVRHVARDARRLAASPASASTSASCSRFARRSRRASCSRRCPPTSTRPATGRYALFPAFDCPALSKGETSPSTTTYDRGTTMVRVVPV